MNSLFFYTHLSHLHLFQALEDEEKMTPEQLAIKNVGKQDPKRHLEEKVYFTKHFYVQK